MKVKLFVRENLRPSVKKAKNFGLEINPNRALTLGVPRLLFHKLDQNSAKIFWLGVHAKYKFCVFWHN